MRADVQATTQGQRYGGIEDIALLGGDAAARTVVGSLLFYCMTVYWASRRPGVHPVATSGGRRLREALEGMKKGAYPVAASGSNPGAIITINDTRGRPSRYDISLHDAPGVDPAILLAKGGDPGARLAVMLQKGLGRLIFGEKYMILADCSTHKSWDADPCRLGASISGLKEMRETACRIGGRMAVPVAIVLTNPDALPDDLQKAPARRIASGYRPLMSSLESSCDMSMVMFFKSRIDTMDGADGSRYRRLAVPLGYNSSEYSRIVSWIVE
ncbi:MAG: hypothetical protein MPJ08_01040 [Nitrosopumilus sp.]|nr:hypothetical protein [Nitrosopumilus sp.]